MPQELTSVIIPSRNTAVPLLQRCIGSIGHNASPMEIVVIDDGSDIPIDPASLPAVCPLRLIRLDTSRGPYRARLHGLRQARGDSVTFVDADDTLSPHAIDHARRVRTRGIDIVQFKIVNRLTRLGLPFAHRGGYDTCHMLEALLYDDSLYPIQICGKLYDRSLLDRAEFLPYEGIWGEDRLFNLSLMPLEPVVTISQKSIYNYYWSTGSTKRNWRSHLTDMKTVHAIKCQYCRDHDLGRMVPQIDTELVAFLEYEVRMMINEGSLTTDFLNRELTGKPWSTMSPQPDAADIYRRNRLCLKRVLKAWLKRYI